MADHGSHDGGPYPLAHHYNPKGYTGQRFYSPSKPSHLDEVCDDGSDSLCTCGEPVADIQPYENLCHTCARDAHADDVADKKYDEIRGM